MAILKHYVCNRCGAEKVVTSPATQLQGWRQAIVLTAADPTVGRQNPEVVWCPPCYVIATTMPAQEKTVEASK